MDDGAVQPEPGDGVPVPATLVSIFERAVALHGAGTDDEAYEQIWSVLEEVRRFGRLAFDVALVGLGSDDPSERAVACDALWELCNPDTDGWSAERAAALVGLAKHESDDDVLWSIAHALDFTEDRRGFEVLLRLRRHPRRMIRLAVARGLPTCGEEPDREALLGALAELMDDPDDEIRDWATFGLGTQTELDGTDVRAVLTRRLDDPYPAARDEAIVGMARRRDRRALPVVAAGLAEDAIGALVIEAAAFLADRSLLGLLRGLEDWWDLKPELLREAVDACDPDHQATRLALFVEVLSRLESALSDRPEVVASLSCGRFDRGVALEVGQADGWTFSYDLDRFVARRCGGDFDLVAPTVLSDLDQR